MLTLNAKNFSPTSWGKENSLVNDYGLARIDGSVTLISELSALADDSVLILLPSE